jgi:hypothetical protein
MELQKGTDSPILPVLLAAGVFFYVHEQGFQPLYLGLAIPALVYVVQGAFGYARPGSFAQEVIIVQPGVRAI